MDDLIRNAAFIWLDEQPQTNMLDLHGLEFGQYNIDFLEVVVRYLPDNLSDKLNNAYLRKRENECKIVRWRFGGFAFSDQARLQS